MASLVGAEFLTGATAELVKNLERAFGYNVLRGDLHLENGYVVHIGPYHQISISNSAHDTSYARDDDATEPEDPFEKITIL